MISKWIGMLVRVLQRSGASRMDKEIHYEELALVVRKADKSQDLQGELARWRLRRANGVVPGQRPAGLQDPGKANGLVQSQRQGMTSVPAGRQLGRVLSYLREGRPFILFSPSADWMGPLTLGRKVCFTQSIDLTVNLIQKHAHKNTQNDVRRNIWVPCGPDKITHKVEYHNVDFHFDSVPQVVQQLFY